MHKLNKKAVVIIVAVVALVAVVGSTFAWFVTRTSLSQQFGISQPDAHRAWCDAEANVGVYLKLKELG